MPRFRGLLLVSRNVAILEIQMEKRNSDDVVGSDLATKVADAMDAGARLAYAHRDYCGMGLCKDGSVYVYGEVMDGDIPSRAELLAWQQPYPGERQEFANREQFISWLQSQSDHTLSGVELADTWLHNNQRITVKRLQEFAAGNSF